MGLFRYCLILVRNYEESICALSQIEFSNVTGIRMLDLHRGKSVKHIKNY